MNEALILSFMILVVDVGNTNISFGIFNQQQELLHSFNLKTERTRTAFEFLTFLEATFKLLNVEVSEIKSVKIASVVPEIERELDILFTKLYKKDTSFITPIDVPIKIDLPNPLEVGVDRVINVFSAFKFYGTEKNVLIIDFGTAITFDIGLKEGTYEGGAIIPGINLALEALKSGTSKLPKVSLKKPNSPVAKTTSEAINVGVFYGYSGMINGMVQNLKEYYNSDFTIIVTGGSGELLDTYFNFVHTLDASLILKGISIL